MVYVINFILTVYDERHNLFLRTTGSAPHGAATGPPGTPPEARTPDKYRNSKAT